MIHKADIVTSAISRDIPPYNFHSNQHLSVFQMMTWTIVDKMITLEMIRKVGPK